MPASIVYASREVGNFEVWCAEKMGGVFLAGPVAKQELIRIFRQAVEAVPLFFANTHFFVKSSHCET
jgi:hypothetical protein